MSVYQRCLSNYQAKQWDVGTWVLFNDTMHAGMPNSLPRSQTVLQYTYNDLGQCLQDSNEAGSSNSYCLDGFLNRSNIAKIDYFEYTKTTPQSINIDACQSFTGPAKLDSGESFRNCLDNYNNTNICKLPGILWSGRSQNKVPVANVHATSITDTVEQSVAVQNAYTSIRSSVMQALDALKDWDASNINVDIFSAEGDLLHQFFDCLMMGALAHTDIWPTPDSRKPVWSRQSDNSDSRAFELPCSGDQLKGRDGVADNNSPFTCGSYARRAAIKYFVRSRQGTQTNANKALVTKAVQELIGNLTMLWSNTNNYMCQCPNGQRDLKCCTLPCNMDNKCACGGNLPDSFACCECDTGNLLPSDLQYAFTHIPGSTLMTSLFDDAATYMQTTVWTNNAPWLLWDQGNDYKWDSSKDAEDAMAFDTTQPVKTYKELGHPFVSTIWEQCHGLIEQIYYTMPTTLNKPTTITSPYDPDGISKTINLTYREEWIQNLVRDAYLKSPIYWQYNVRHKPSNSLVCKNKTKQYPKMIKRTIGNATINIHGYHSMTIGKYEVDCYCGWWYNTSTCQIPPAICTQLVQLVSTVEIIQICNAGGFTTTPIMETYMQLLTQLKGNWQWPCMQMDLSDMYGIMEADWPSGSTDSTKIWNQVLVNGTSGLRVGSLDWVAANTPVDPSMRINTLKNAGQQCDIDMGSISDHWIDELFPAVQGIRQNVALNACLRFTIELARLYMFKQFELAISIAEQQALVNSWRQKCELKLEQVSFCTTFGVYDIFQDRGYQCDFGIGDAFKVEPRYSITPTCLIVYKPNNELKLYDPCLCGFCTTAKINLFEMANKQSPNSCEILHVRNLVLDNGIPIWPATSTSTVPLPWQRSNIINNLPLNVANNKGKWDTSEGNASMYYCDMQMDWWPEEWLHPVGFHVTFPCSGGIPRTFDAAWAYLKVGDQVKLRHVPVNLRNQTKRQNEFGGAGPCRTSNYGMPMHTLNTIRICTKADNQPYDPTVPNKTFQSPQWNNEYCSASPYDVPWKNGPSSVGMLFDRLVDILPGDYDNSYKTCVNDTDCCASCKCFIGKLSYGICVVLQTGVFECAQHKHCSGGLMCSGEGLCVKGMMQVLNNFTDDVTVRTFSDQCVGQDTWGTSKEEIVPDILHSSGMCSYRSWYEHRQVSGTCSSDSCTVQGRSTWPSTQVIGSAFDTDVLKVKAHACDRDYEHFQGLRSCNPSSMYMVSATNVPQSILNGRFTQTYRNDLSLKVVRHDDFANLGLGFTGTGKLYKDMGYLTANDATVGTSIMKPCSSLLPCTLQSMARMWYVNGVIESQRWVTQAGTVRLYNTDDLSKCGSMGFVFDATYCLIDAAVAPLFYVYCNTRSSGICATYNGGKYTFSTGPTYLKTIADNINGLFNTMAERPATFSSYIQSVNNIQVYWDAIQGNTWSNSNAKVLQTYSGVRPRGLYWLMSYSAYEFPFAYWFRCTWLSGLTLLETPTTCDAWDNQQAPTTNTDPVFYGTFSARGYSMTLMQWLASLGGVFTSNRVQEARNNVHGTMYDKIKNANIDHVPRFCYSQASFNKQYLQTSTQYQDMAKNMQCNTWRSQKLDVCANFSSCFDHTDKVEMVTENIVQDTINTYLTMGPCTLSCYTAVTPNIQSFAQDNVPLTMLSDQPYLPLFTLKGSDNIVSPYNDRPDGCNTPTCCTGSTPCDCYTSTVTASEVSEGLLPAMDSSPAWLAFSKSSFPSSFGNGPTSSGTDYIAIDICDPSTTCGFATPTPKDTCNKASSDAGRAVQNTYCGDNAPLEWKQDPDNERCVYNIDNNNKVQCLGLEIKNSKVSYDSNFLSVSYYNIPPTACWTLSCVAPLAQYDGKKVPNLTPYKNQTTIKLKAVFANWQYSTSNLYVNLSVLSGNTYIREWAGDKECDTRLSRPNQCKLNTKNTRPVSSEYTGWAYVEYPNTLTFAVPQYAGLVSTIVQKIEDRLNLESTKSTKSNCLLQTPPMVDLICVYDDDATTKLLESSKCSDEELYTVCEKKYYAECTKWAIANARCESTCEPFASQLPAWVFGKCVGKWITTCYDQAERYKTCINVQLNSNCRSQLTCTSYTYQYITPPACTGTSTTCPYSQTAEQAFQTAGLPNVGFCPACTGFGCLNTKSSTTYNNVNANIGGYSINPVPATPMVNVGAYAQYFGMKLDSKYKCNDITCPAKSHKAQIRKNLYACVPCRTIPPTYCTGNHMCGFADGATFQSKYTDIKQQLLNIISNITTSVVPQWKDFLTYLPFSYNPQPLRATYNSLMESVNGMCSNANDIPDLTQCQNDRPRQKLQSHYLQYYKVTDGYVVPKQNTMIWYTDNKQLLSTNIISYFQSSKSKFIQDLLNNKTCNTATLDSLVCYKEGTAFRILNPSIVGDFEVQEGCDVVQVDGMRIIDGICRSDVCGDPRTNDKYNTFSGTAYNDLTKRTQCGIRNGQTSKYMTTRSSYNINLCTKTPNTPSSCGMVQGMIGGGDGQPVSTVYSRGVWPKSWVASGLFQNPVLQKKTAEYGNITMDPTDIGGHFIKMVIDTNGLLKVQDIPLRSYNSLQNALTANTSSWMTDYKQARDFNLYTLQTCQSWLCPITRRNFWTGNGKQRPQTPHPIRTKILYGSTTHPTTRTFTNQMLGTYQTRNGFCLCPTGNTCKPASGPCSVSDTTASLSDFVYRPAQVLQTPCTLQTDWPYTGGVMRDESYLVPKTQTCHVLDRIPPFLYRFDNCKQYLQGQKSTLDEGGACHMGRPVAYDSTVDRCTLLEKRDDVFILDCGSNTVTLPRPKSTIETKKRPCDQCDKLPVYEDANGTILDNEVSYGQLWKWSPARLLARDLRFRLCGNATFCDAAKQWTLDTFWPNMKNSINTLFQEPAATEEAAWSTNWMLCTGKNAANCQGKASKAQWIQNRPGTCKTMLSLSNVNDASENLTICNLDSRLDTLCRVVQAARYRVFEANCQVTGSCRTSSFFYQPATYDLSNNQFVQETVGYFYNFTVPGTCPIYDNETMTVVSQNQARVQQCAAQDLQLFQVAITLAREVVHLICKISYYWIKIEIGICSIFLGGVTQAANTGAILSAIMADFKSIIQEFNKFFRIAADLVYKMMTEAGTLGKWLKTLVIGICGFLRDVVDGFIRPLVCSIRSTVLFFFDVYIGIINVINKFGDMSGTLNNLQATRKTLSNSWKCDVSNPFLCDQLDNEPANLPAILPVATRCWMGYTEEGAGCEASDTCLNDNGDLVVCAACTGDVNMVRFGCSPLTKMCQCHIFPQDQASCTTNQECGLPDVGCGFVDGYLQPGFGNVPCTSCTTQAQCLITSGIGKCVCLLKPMQFQTCAASGQRVVPDASKLCLLSASSSLSNAQYVANYRTLATTSCALLNSAQSFCLQVYLSADTSTLLTVGFSLLRARRLLTQITPMPINWTNEPCRSVMNTNDRRPMEQYIASECERWYEIGELTIMRFNLSASPNVFTDTIQLVLMIANQDNMVEIITHIAQYTEYWQPIYILAKRFNTTIVNRPLIQFIAKHIPHPKDLFPPPNFTTFHTDVNTTNDTRVSRRLLQTWKDSMQKVQQYSIDISNNKVTETPNLNDWKMGPFTWPPSYNYWDTAFPCLAGSLAFNYTWHTMESTIQCYINTPRDPLPSSFSASLPNIPKLNVPRKPTSWAIDLITQFTSIDISDIRHYVSSKNNAPSQLSTDIHNIFTCNFDYVQHCSGQYRTLGWGAVIVLLAFIFLSLLLKFFYISGIDTILIILYVPAVLFFTYNYTIFCAPMIPTCVGDDIILIIEWFFPASWYWPDQLQLWPQCINGKQPLTSTGEVNWIVQGSITPGSSDCFRSCTDWPFNFNTWQDNAAWLACDMGYCDSTYQYIGWWRIAHDTVQPYIPFSSYLSPDPFVNAINAKYSLVDLPGMRTAQRICWSFTIVQFIPLVFAIVALAILLVTTISAAVFMVQFIVNMIISLLVFIHIN